MVQDAYPLEFDFCSNFVIQTERPSAEPSASPSLNPTMSSLPSSIPTHSPSFRPTVAMLQTVSPKDLSAFPFDSAVGAPE